MSDYSPVMRVEVRKLRSLGKTYNEIKKNLGINLPKSTLYEWCKGIVLPPEYIEKVGRLNFESLKKAQERGRKINKAKREAFFEKIYKINFPVSEKIQNKNVAKIALAMLCLGEAAKYGSGAVFSLGSSNPKIIVLFLALLKECFSFNLERVRCTVQCRADQNTIELEHYWQKVSGVPERLFYKARIDPRTIGKPTKKTNYHGVLKVDYMDTGVQLELESLTDLIYNHFAL